MNDSQESPSVSKSKLHKEGCECAPKRGSATSYTSDAVTRSACLECEAGKPCTCLDKGKTKSYKDTALIKNASSEIHTTESVESEAPIFAKKRVVLGDEGKEIAPGALPSPEPSQYKEWIITGVHAVYRILALILTCLEKLVEMVDNAGWLSNETAKSYVDMFMNGVRKGLEFIKDGLNKIIDLLHGDRKLVSPARHIS